MTREEQALIKEQNELKRIKETALLCTEFLLTNLSDIDLSNKTGISSSTVGRRLKDEVYVNKAYDIVKNNLINAGLKEEEMPKSSAELYNLISLKRQENLLKGKALGGQTTLLNHVYLKDEDKLFQGVTKLSLSAIYSTEENQYRFLINAALYFHLHLDTLSILFQIDEKELLNNMLNYGNHCYESLKTLFYHDNKEQNAARNNFVNYYRELIEAVRHKDLEEKKRLITLIGDKNALELNKKIKEERLKKTNISLSDEDIEIIIRYQLKYSLTIKSTAYIFGLNRNSYLTRVNRFLENHPELRNDYENLIAYNNYKHKMSNGGYRGK